MKDRQSAVDSAEAGEPAHLLVHDILRRINALVRFKVADNDNIWGDGVVIAKSGGKLRVLARGLIEGDQVRILLESGNGRGSEAARFRIAAR